MLNDSKYVILSINWCKKCKENNKIQNKCRFGNKVSCTIIKNDI